jgi:hypothetical protein
VTKGQQDPIIAILLPTETVFWVKNAEIPMDLLLLLSLGDSNAFVVRLL